MECNDDKNVDKTIAFMTSFYYDMKISQAFFCMKTFSASLRWTRERERDKFSNIHQTDAVLPAVRLSSLTNLTDIFTVENLEIKLNFTILFICV